jgi:hypothetical protein
MRDLSRREFFAVIVRLSGLGKMNGVASELLLVDVAGIRGFTNSGHNGTVFLELLSTGRALLDMGGDLAAVTLTEVVEKYD